MGFTADFTFHGLNNIRRQGSRCQTQQKDCATGGLRTFLETMDEHAISP